MQPRNRRWVPLHPKFPPLQTAAPAHNRTHPAGLDSLRCVTAAAESHHAKRLARSLGRMDNSLVQRGLRADRVLDPLELPTHYGATSYQAGHVESFKGSAPPAIQKFIQLVAGHSANERAGYRPQPAASEIARKALGVSRRSTICQSSEGANFDNPRQPQARCERCVALDGLLHSGRRAVRRSSSSSELHFREHPGGGRCTHHEVAGTAP